MKDQAIGATQVRVDHDANMWPASWISPNGDTESRSEAERRHQPLRRSEAQTIVTDDFHQLSKIGLLRDFENHEVMPIAFLVPEEEVFRLSCLRCRPNVPATSAMLKTGGCV